MQGEGRGSGAGIEEFEDLVEFIRIKGVMDFNLLGTMLDSANSAKLSMEEKTKLVYELAKHPDGNPEMLLSWSRQEILQILCAEMGKERKYTGLTKLKIIENLFKIVSEKNPRESAAIVSEKPIAASSVNKTPNGGNAMQAIIHCKNSACRASLSPDDVFCKRCSCCICRKFDDNKDPSLWLTCSSEPPFEGESCNMSCHLDCALRHGRSGLSKRGQVAQLDGSFYCVACGKTNDLMRCWRKQLMIARDTRRADILCYRVSLSQKLVSGTNKYEKLSDIVDEAVNKLQAEVGTLTDITVKMGRGIVNRMSSGHEVQRLCTSAVELLDSLLSESTIHTPSRPSDQDSSTIRFEDVCDTSVIVILGPEKQASETNLRYTMCHYKAVDEKEPPEPTCTMSPPGTRIVVGGLAPSTEYVFKVVCFDSVREPTTYETRLSTAPPNTEIIHGTTTLESSQSPVTNCSTLSNPSSVEDETNNITSCIGQDESSVRASEGKNAPNLDKSGTPNLENNANESNELVTTEQNIIPSNPPVTGLPITPFRMDILEKIGKNRKKDPQPRSSSQKRKRESQEENACNGNENHLEFFVKDILRLESEGHIEKSFRKKFLTWYSLKATPQEMKVMQVFVNTFRDDPASLAEQLIDAFEEIVSSQRLAAPIQPGFCMKLWH